MSNRGTVTVEQGFHGKWSVRQDDKRVSRFFDTREEAMREAARLFG